MLSLKRAPNGDWFARKVIPADVRESYKAAHGVSREELFRRPAGLREGQAKQELREWDALVSGRIEGFRARTRGEGVSLSTRQAHGLAGEWYGWFVGRRQEDPGTLEEWEDRADNLDNAYARWASEGASDLEEGDDEGETEAPAVRRYVRARLAALADVPEFLGTRGLVLSPDAHDLFLDVLEPDFRAALVLLRRRSGGDYRPDQHPERFPDAPPLAPVQGRRPHVLGIVRGLGSGAAPRGRDSQPFAYSDEAGRGFRFEAGRHSEAKPATGPI